MVDAQADARDLASDIVTYKASPTPHTAARTPTAI
jgi:hypothetical protein